MSPRTTWLLGGLALLVLTIALSLFAIDSEDLLMYLAIAKTILSGNHLPETDPFLFTIPNYNWHIAHQWLSYLIFYNLDIIGGWTSIIAFKAALILLLPLTVLIVAWKRSEFSPFSLLLIALALASSAWRFVERSALFSDILTVAVLGILLSNRQRSTRAFYFLPLLFLLWVNLHPGFPVGLLFCYLFLAENFNRRSVAIAFLSTAVCLLNPLGWDGAVYPFVFANREAITFMKYYTEWWPAYGSGFIQSDVAPAFFALILVVFSLMIYRRAKKPWVDAIVAVVMTSLAIKAVRFVPMASFCLALIGVQLMGPMRSSFWSTRLNLGVFALTSLFAIKIFFWGYTTLGLKREISFDLDRKAFPIGNAQILETLPLQWNMLNNHNFGGYLAWRFDGRRKLFYHGFVTDTDFFENEFLRIPRTQDDFNELVKKYDIRIILVDSGGGYRAFLDRVQNHPEWRFVGSDPASVMWVREP